MANEFNTKFEYSPDINTTLLPWRDKIGAKEFDDVLPRLLERDRELEDYISIAPVYEFDPDTLIVTTAGPVADGPSVTLKVPRGICHIHVGALVYCSVTNQTAYADIYMDGSFLQTGIQLGNNSGGSLAVSCASLAYFDNLEPGTHTFSLRYGNTLAPNAVEFAGRFILVTPIP